MNQQESVKLDQELESDSKKPRSRRANQSRRYSDNGRAPLSQDAVGIPVSRDHTNDPQWYMQFGQLANDVATLNFSQVVGIAKTLMSYNTDVIPNSTYRIPGIMALNVTPTFGCPKDGTSAINVAAQAFYSYIRHKNSGARNYFAPDLVMYLGGMDSAYIMYGQLVRLYGIVQEYSYANRYLPDAVIYNLGFTPSFVRGNIAQIRGLINIYAHKLSSLAVPANISYISRHMWMAMNVFRDSDTRKAQMYFYNFTTLYKYNSTAEGGGALEPVTIPRFTTLNQLETFCNELFAPLFEDEDAGLISGDIIKAFGDSAIYQLSPISEDFHIDYTFSEEVLSQIENLCCVSGANVSALTQVNEINASYVTQSITCNPIASVGIDPNVNTDLVRASNTQLLRDRVLNMHWNDPTTGDVLVATRMMPGSATYNAANDIITINACGSEICTGIQICSLFGGQYLVRQISTEMTLALLGASAEFPTAMAYWMECLTKVSVFDWAPITHLMYTVSSEFTLPATDYGAIGDIDNYTVVNPGSLDDMHEAAMLSLWYINGVSMTN